tara:strand:- start:592 stop:741 length:150 start_codon:yes stop_codon:yes gene_type:complete
MEAFLLVFVAIFEFALFYWCGRPAALEFGSGRGYRGGCSKDAVNPSMGA